jgi:uracil-DNA glycosylase family 4
VADTLEKVKSEVESCALCPRLVGWRQQAAAEPPRRYRGERYWARPLPGFGDARAKIVVIGLAPAAHGGNRTGRIFTGDRSGDWLFAAIHRVGLSNQATSDRRGDGLSLFSTWITAAVRCAPPANRPLPEERDNCLAYLERELALLDGARVLVALGSFAWNAIQRALKVKGHELPRPRPRFTHGAETTIGPYAVLGCFHPSQQNTFTGKLTEQMTDDVLLRAKGLAGLPQSPADR